ncbi:MAG: valine--tRNA ligase [Candidatus Azambacteria bacterium]|nr:valine--tRNA ligase [Candidatus Azambacteria bacterium]
MSLSERIEKFNSAYDPKKVEHAIYTRWEESGFFNPDNLPERHVEPYSIMLPPPNVTGTLHMGHAAMLAIEDVLIRFERMRGKRTLWLPGTDHASIATQSKVEEILSKKENTTRHVLGRDAFLDQVTAFARESHDTIVSQVKKMGSSVDWSREAYTLDETRHHAVHTAFKRMYDAGLIVQGNRIVNWDPKGQTVISDDEIIYKEETTKFYYFKYGPFTIGTARPETKFADKYVVMHPDDVRYKEYTHGQTLEVEWINGPLTATIIKDGVANPEFGTGVMTITPWHSTIDFDIAERHKLEGEQIIDKYGKLLPVAGEFAGMKIKDAREKIVEKLAAKGLVVSVEENYLHNVATAERTGATIEPQVMKQWFVAVTKEFTIPHSEIPGIPSGSRTTLKDIMRSAVESGATHIMPERFEKIYFHWINNLRDWCISRQIWFGHRIPVWYRGEEIYCDVTPPEGEGWEQDQDTLDTWFSSGLWTFSTLGWPEQTKDLATYHPTNVLETGYDIIFFWVARMILMSGFHLGTIPFKNVYLHGLVRDEKGRKMSKSLGNIINPLDMIEKYGADATRISLIIGAAPGNDTKLSEERIRGYKHFANKLWNITRFVVENRAHTDSVVTQEEDKKLLEEFNTVARETTAHIEAFRLDLAADTLYHFVWHRFADVIIEESKPILRGDNATAQASRQATLFALLVDSLKLLHPFMPFITEEIYGSISHPNAPLLMIEEWPTM